MFGALIDYAVDIVVGGIDAAVCAVMVVVVVVMWYCFRIRSSLSICNYYCYDFYICP